MHPLSRRRIAAITLTALVAGGCLTSAARAADPSSDTAPDAPARLLGDVVGALPGDIVGTPPGDIVGTPPGDIVGSPPGDIVGAPPGDIVGAPPGDVVGAPPSLLDNVLTQTTAELQATLATLTAAQIGDLLVAATSPQLTKLLEAATASQLGAALATLASANLTKIVGGLSPAQISDLVAGGGGATVIDGLLGTATALAGGSPGAPAVDGLLAQVGALLGGGLPTDADQLADLGTLLTTVRSLLATPGLDTSVLRGVLATAEAIIASAADGAALAPLSEFARRIASLVAASGGAAPGGTAPPAATNGGRPSARPPAGALPAAPRFTAYRARIGSVRLAKKRTSASLRVRCPATAPKGCLVRVSAKVAGRRSARPKVLVLVRGTTARVTLKLSRSAARRLRQKGGPLRLSAQTRLSSLPAVTKTVKVKRPRKRR